jgi:outer membrane protein TolC
MVGVDFERMGTTRFDIYSGAEWMVAQKLPIAGKNLSAARAADAEARAAWEDVRRLRFDLAAKARAASYRLANAHAQLAINAQNEKLIGRALEIGNAKLSVGKSAQADVLAIDVDLQKLALERESLEQALSGQETALNVLLNRPAGTPLGKPSPLAFRPLSWSASALEARILVLRPEIAALEQRLQAEEARLQRARREWIPEPQVRVEARHFRGSSETFTEYDTGIFFSIPWANPGKYSASVHEAQQMVEAARRELEAGRTTALGLLRDQLRKIATLRRQYELSRDKLVPLARKTEGTLQINYQADTASFIELLTAQKVLRDTEAAASTQLTEYLAALAELEAIVGAGRTELPQGAPVPRKERSRP